MHPVIVEIGPVTLFSFGLLVALAFLIGTLVSARGAHRHGLSGDAILDAAIWVLLGALLGARLLFVGLNWDAWSETSRGPLDLVATWKGGMSFHGGVLGGLLGGWIYARIRRLPTLSLLDAVMPGVALGYAIGRVGCLLNGCCQGVPTDLPWGVRFLTADGHWGEPHHPAQIYASLAGLALFALVLKVRPRLTVPGQLSVFVLFGYSCYRFLVEFVRRGESAQLFALGLTEAQWASLAGIALALLFWQLLRRSAAKRPPPPEAVPRERRGARR